MSEGLSTAPKGWFQSIGAVLVRSIRHVTGTYFLKEHIDKRLNENGLQLSANDMAIMNKLIELDRKMNSIERDISSLRDVIEKRSAR